MSSWNRVEMIQTDIVTSHTLRLATDASFKGMGAVYQNQWISARWPTQLVEHHINFLELFAIVAAVVTWGSEWTNQQILIYTDNQIRLLPTYGNPVLAGTKTSCVLFVLYLHTQLYPILTFCSSIYQDILITSQIVFLVCRWISSGKPINMPVFSNHTHQTVYGISIETDEVFSQQALVTSTSSTYRSGLTSYITFCRQTLFTPFPYPSYYCNYMLHLYHVHCHTIPSKCTFPPYSSIT